jgi:hypothetical protein
VVSADFSGDAMGPNAIKAYVKTVPLGRIGQAAYFVGLAIFLASEA